jgi:hypothetical protein
MPNTRPLRPHHESPLHQKRLRDLKIALIYGLICSGLVSCGIYLIYMRQRF